MKPVSDHPYFFETSITIQPGIHRYKFMVDGKWRYDPNEDSKENIYGTQDNILQVFPAIYEVSKDESDIENTQIVNFSNDGVRIKIKTELSGKLLAIKGSWDNWESITELKRNKAYLRLYPGVYQFKFICDGNWMIDQSLMRCDDGFGGYNNIIKVKEKNNKPQWKPEGLQWIRRKEDGLNFTAI